MAKFKGSNIILEKDGKILLQLRDDKEGIEWPGYWSFFGGGPEGDETPEETAVRETLEEVGLEIKEVDLDLFYRWEGEFGTSFVFSTLLNVEVSDLKLMEGQDMKLFGLEDLEKEEKIVPLVKKIGLDYLSRSKS